VRTSQRDLAVNELMRKITVASEPRSYLISVTTTAGDPERAATLANTVASEYHRGQMLQQLADTTAAAEHELTQLSSVYGVRHPSYVLARTRLGTLQNRLILLRHNFSLPVSHGIGSATRTSRQSSCDRVDQSTRIVAIELGMWRSGRKDRR
jgi:hypothetical protein